MQRRMKLETAVPPQVHAWLKERAEARELSLRRFTGDLLVDVYQRVQRHDKVSAP